MVYTVISLVRICDRCVSSTVDYEAVGMLSMVLHIDCCGGGV